MTGDTHSAHASLSVGEALQHFSVAVLTSESLSSGQSDVFQ
jgi:hypothetical protein